VSIRLVRASVHSNGACPFKWSIHGFAHTHTHAYARWLARTHTRYTHARTHACTHVGLMRLVEWLPGTEGIRCVDLSSSDVISPDTIKKLVSRSKT